MAGNATVTSLLMADDESMTTIKLQAAFPVPQTSRARDTTLSVTSSTPNPFTLDPSFARHEACRWSLSSLVLVRCSSSPRWEQAWRDMI